MQGSSHSLPFVGEKLIFIFMNLNQVTIPVLDLERAIAFYRKLGLRLIVHSNDRYARFVCPDPADEQAAATFSLHVVEELPKGDGSWLYFEVKDVRQTVKELEQKGIVFEEHATEQSWLWTEARLKDPDGNQLLIYC